MSSRGRRLRALAGCLVAAGLFLGVAAGVADAASASPAASAEPSAEPDAGIEYWLDRPLPVNPAPGSSFDLAFSTWDRERGEFAQLGDVFVRVSPASGSAAPVEAMARGDWPGHAATRITVPAGGLGDLFVGFHGQSCDASGTCTASDLAFALGGIGPPPNARPIDLFLATIREPAEPLVAGEPTEIEVDLSPRADWDAGELPFPGQLILIARHPRGPDLANVPLTHGRVIGEPYTGRVIVPEAGDVTLEVDMPGVGGAADERFPTSIMRMTVLPAGAGDAEPAAAADGAGDGVPLPLLVGGFLALAAIGLVVRRVFADL